MFALVLTAKHVSKTGLGVLVCQVAQYRATQIVDFQRALNAIQTPRSRQIKARQMNKLGIRNVADRYRTGQRCKVAA